MSEENSSAKMPEPESTADDSQKLTEDARGLGPRQTGPFAIGLVDMIVGEGGLEVPGLAPTKYETLLLVRAWAGEILDRDFGFFLYGSVGSSEWRIREYANRRLNTIAKAIGEEEVKKAFKIEIPVKDRDGWEKYLSEQSAKVIKLMAEIEAAEGTSIFRIFETRGEAEFRRSEREKLRQHVRAIECGRPAVVALGSGRGLDTAVSFAEGLTRSKAKARLH